MNMRQKRAKKVIRDFLLKGTDVRQMTRLEESLTMIWASGNPELIGSVLVKILPYIETPAAIRVKVQGETNEGVAEQLLTEIFREEQARIRQLGSITTSIVDDGNGGNGHGNGGSKDEEPPLPAEVVNGDDDGNGNGNGH